MFIGCPQQQPLGLHSKWLLSKYVYYSFVSMVKNIYEILFQGNGTNAPDAVDRDLAEKHWSLYHISGRLVCVPELEPACACFLVCLWLEDSLSLQLGIMKVLASPDLAQSSTVYLNEAKYWFVLQYR